VSARGNCDDNTAEESWNHSIKLEAIHGERFATRDWCTLGKCRAGQRQTRHPRRVPRGASGQVRAAIWLKRRGASIGVLT